MYSENLNQVTGNIFNIQRFSIHDGPGIRTTVFFKACPLNCVWCHNPESISSTPILSFLPDKCIGCGYCFKVCPTGAHLVENDRHIIDREKCNACGLCTKECYSKALELVGKTVTVADMMKDVLADKPFYDTSGGGMTLSGGEPLMQPEFCYALLKEAKSQGLHCCVDTCGHVKWEVLDKIRENTDLFLYDIKDTNPQRHEKNTGVENGLIFENLTKLHDTGAKIWIRIPLIPGWNDAEDNLDGLVSLLKSLPNIEAVEIMPYHKLGQSKLDRFGLVSRMTIDCNPPQAETMDNWINALKALDIQVLNNLE